MLAIHAVSEINTYNQLVKLYYINIYRTHSNAKCLAAPGLGIYRHLGLITDHTDKSHII